MALQNNDADGMQTHLKEMLENLQSFNIVFGSKTAHDKDGIIDQTMTNMCQKFADNCIQFSTKTGQTASYGDEGNQVLNDAKNFLAGVAMYYGEGVIYDHLMEAAKSI